jgi:uncharacterized protein (DUF58 family)
MKARRLTLAVLFLSAFLCILYSGERFFLWIFAATASVFVFALLNIAYTLRYMIIRQWVSPAEVTAGEHGAFTIDIYNRGFFPLAHMDVWYDTAETLIDGIPGGIDAEGYAARSFVTGVQPGGYRTIREEFYFPYRGCYTPGVMQIRICDIFGLINFKLPKSRFQHKQLVTVLPRVSSQDIESWGENPYSAGAARGLDEQEPYSVADIRHYQPGDPLKRVHWKLTARTGRLQVKEFDGVLSPRASVFLDLSPHGCVGEEAAALEDQICTQAAAVCKAALDKLMPLRFVACEDKPVALSCGASSDLIAIRRFLAGLAFRCPYPFREVVRMEMEAHPEAGDIVIITTELSSDLAGYMDSLSADGRAVRVITVSKGEGAAVHT